MRLLTLKQGLEIWLNASDEESLKIGDDGQVH